MNKKITKIKLTKKQLEEIDKINKKEKVTTTTMATRKSDGKRYEFTTSRYLTKDTAKKRLIQIYGGICVGCGLVWPDYKVSYDYGDENQAAVRIERYCSSCWKKWKDRL